MLLESTLTFDDENTAKDFKQLFDKNYVHVKLTEKLDYIPCDIIEGSIDAIIKWAEEGLKNDEKNAEIYNEYIKAHNRYKIPINYLFENYSPGDRLFSIEDVQNIGTKYIAEYTGVKLNKGIKIPECKSNFLKNKIPDGMSPIYFSQFLEQNDIITIRGDSYYLKKKVEPGTINVLLKINVLDKAGFVHHPGIRNTFIYTTDITYEITLPIEAYKLISTEHLCDIINKHNYNSPDKKEEINVYRFKQNIFTTIMEILKNNQGISLEHLNDQISAEWLPGSDEYNHSALMSEPENTVKIIDELKKAGYIRGNYNSLKAVKMPGRRK
ncbi:hypothetical protein [Methanoplanus endosymbiosus]|uniref:Uncharacterized protein n=1 Tax=Methanoplanus endosymbiosus TaxID=33865 RepID=A0A9E7PNG9_9EURY|nr:hypothetical protein [Methanoplanus endosymbiosus]UUX92552.1 hypothetical protein L6E24_00035 [Methanoplanus endosymbiosus]